MKKTFEGNSDRVEQEAGSWGFSSDRLVLVLKSSGDAWSWFAMPGPGVLRAVDAHGESIGQRVPIDLQRSGSFSGTDAPAVPNAAATPRLVTLPLAGTGWTLTELQNGPVRPATETRRDILLTFNADTSTFSGSGSCGPLEGDFDASWRTLTMTSRKSPRACRTDAANERALVAAIKATRTYRITGATLDLFDERGGRVARFERK